MEFVKALKGLNTWKLADKNSSVLTQGHTR